MNNHKTTISFRIDDCIADKFYATVCKESTKQGCKSEAFQNAMIDYIEKHGDSNSKVTLEQFQDESFKACPAFYRNNATWTEYLLTIEDDKVQSKEFDEHLGMLLRTWNDVFSGRIRKHD